MTYDLVQEEIGQTHCLAMTIPLLVGVGFLSCLAATSKRRAGSYKRALISAEPPDPHPSIPLSCPGGWAEGWSTTRGKQNKTKQALTQPNISLRKPENLLINKAVTSLQQIMNALLCFSRK